MAADVFETYAVSLIGAIFVGYLTLKSTPAAIFYPFFLGGISVIGSILGIFYVNASNKKPGAALITRERFFSHADRIAARESSIGSLFFGEIVNVYSRDFCLFKSLSRT
jgi:Na+/H+-translocating membrane pyrophosphatase